MKKSSPSNKNHPLLEIMQNKQRQRKQILSLTNKIKNLGIENDYLSTKYQNDNKEEKEEKKKLIRKKNIKNNSIMIIKNIILFLLLPAFYISIFIYIKNPFDKKSI